MRRPFLLLVFILFWILSPGQGQQCEEDLFPKRGDNRMFGFVNIFGQWRVQPIYTQVFPFHGETAIVLKKGKYGAVNCESQVVLKTEFDEIKPFAGGVAWARKNGLWGLYDSKGKELLAPVYEEIDEVSRFSKVTFVKHKDAWGIYAQYDQKFLFEPQFESYQSLNSQFSLVRMQGKVGVVKLGDSTFAHDPNIDAVVKVAPYVMSYRKGNHWGVMNDQGVELTQAEFDTVVAHYKFRLLVKQRGKYGLVNYDGQKVAPIIFEEIAPFQEGGARVKLDGKYGFISVNGGKVIPNVYEDAHFFKDKLAAVKKDGFWGVIQPNENWIIPKVHQAMERGKGGYYVGALSKGTLLYGLDGKRVLNDTLMDVHITDDPAFTRVLLDKKWWFLNTDLGQYAIEQGFEQANAFAHDVAFVQKDGRWGAIDPGGKVVVPMEYDSLGYFPYIKKYVGLVYTSGKVGLRDFTGREILPPRYKRIVRGSDNTLKLEDEQGFWLSDFNGTIFNREAYDNLSMDDFQSDGAPPFPAIFELKGVYGLVHNRSREVLSPKYRDLKYVGDGVFAGKEKKGWVVLSEKGIPFEGKTYTLFDDVFGGGDRFVGVKKDAKWGYWDWKAKKMKITPQYDQIEAFSGDIAVVRKGAFFGAINKLGKPILPIEYTSYNKKGSIRILSNGANEKRISPNGEILP